MYNNSIRFYLLDFRENSAVKYFFCLSCSKTLIFLLAHNFQLKSKINCVNLIIVFLPFLCTLEH